MAKPRMPLASRMSPRLQGQKPWRGWALLLLVLLCLSGMAIAPWSADGEISPIDLRAQGRLYLAGEEAFPADEQALAAWLEQPHAPAQLSLLGGAYWLYTEFRLPPAGSDWVFNPDNTLIEQVEARIYAPDGAVQTLLTGYRHRHDYLLHYGKRLPLLPGQDYRILVRFSSPYFASYPNFSLLPETQYRRQSTRETLVAVGCVGALAALAIFNLFIYSLARDKSRLYYAIYLVVYGAGWVFAFHIPSEVFGLYNLHLHYLPFFLIPVCSTLFYLEFLRLAEKFPRLAQISRLNLILPLLLLPSCWLALSYAHLLATLALSLWLLLALVSGIACWRGGFRPARYFTVAFTALLIPGLIILPANAGLLPDLVENAELYTLIGGTLDALLLSFALADNIKLMEQEKDSYLRQLNLALKQAQTDGLTGLGNRYAFDQLLQRHFQFLTPPDEETQHLLAIIDLDGLKYINDHHGHAAGDELLLLFARGLADLCRDGTACFRLGGDEFAIVARKTQEQRLHQALADIEHTLSRLGYARTGLSYGIAYAHECATPADLFNISDQRMYRNKQAKKQQAPAA